MNKHRVISDFGKGRSIKTIAKRERVPEGEVRELLESVGFALTYQETCKKRPNNYADSGGSRRRDTISPAEVCKWMRRWPLGA